MVLFWAESAVIGFWNVIKLAVVGKWALCRGFLEGPTHRAEKIARISVRNAALKHCVGPERNFQAGS
jgi:hypothetical protein